ncbi:MAG: hypothetical protein AAF570_15590, partial [Bacteroidota bacterium]
SDIRRNTNAQNKKRIQAPKIWRLGYFLRTLSDKKYYNRENAQQYAQRTILSIYERTIQEALCNPNQRINAQFIAVAARWAEYLTRKLPQDHESEQA